LEKKDHIDLYGTIALIALSALLGINHVVIKVVNTGLNPVFFAGLRSVIAFIFLVIYFKITNKKMLFSRDTMAISILAGVVFALEFLFLFLALDFTTVTRNSILYYSMPIWITAIGHFFLPNEKLSFFKALGLIFAFAGVVLAISDNQEPLSIHNWQLIGDFLAIMAGNSMGNDHLSRKGHKIQRGASRNATCLDATDLWPSFINSLPVFW
jgi:drug/metabolite transporter (DMT)-like permease